MKQGKKRVLGDAFLAAVRSGAVDMQWQPGHSFGEYPHTGVHRRGLHGGSLVDGFSADRAPEQERPPSADTVCRLIAGTEQPGKDAQTASPPKMGMKKGRPIGRP